MDTRDVINALEFSPYWTLLGMKVGHLEKNFARLHLPFSAHLEQIFSVMHGGALASLLDAAGAVAFFPELDLARETISTIELKINYLNPVTRGQVEVIASGQVIKKGKKVGVSRIEIHNASQELVAIGIGTYAIVPRDT